MGFGPGSLLKGDDMNACQRCGAPFPEDLPTPSSCHLCPPVPCADCGGRDDRNCPCWISLENDTLADSKAMFAAMGLTVSLTGEVSR